MPVKNVKVSMSFIRKQIADRVNAGVLATVNAMKEELTLATPVDTGRARDGWEVREVRGAKYPTFEVINEVPYISALNEGHSDQAPARFIETIALRYGRAVGQVVTYKDE